MQSRLSSLIEQFANIGSGFVLSSILWHFVVQPIWHIETSFAENLQITSLFTRPFWLIFSTHLACGKTAA